MGWIDQIGYLTPAYSFLLVVLAMILWTAMIAMGHEWAEEQRILTDEWWEDRHQKALDRIAELEAANSDLTRKRDDAIKPLYDMRQSRDVWMRRYNDAKKVGDQKIAQLEEMEVENNRLNRRLDAALQMIEDKRKEMEELNEVLLNASACCSLAFSRASRMDEATKRVKLGIADMENHAKTVYAELKEVFGSFESRVNKDTEVIIP